MDEPCLPRRARHAQRRVARRRGIRARGGGSRRDGRGQRFVRDVFRCARETQAVVGRAAAALADGAEDVAILVRARAHLEALLPALRVAAIPYAAVELDALGERQAVQDLVSLAHALLQPADRLAWLAVLRAPWCGLALPDLFAVVAAADAGGNGSIAGLMRTAESIAGLTSDGRTRLARVAPILAGALAARGRASVAARIRGAWLAIGGGATITEPIDLDAAERFLSLLAAHEVAGDVPDWPALVDSLARLHAEPDSSAGARLQIMNAPPCQRARVRYGDPAGPGARSQSRRSRDPPMAPAPARTVACADEGARRRCGSGLCLPQGALPTAKRAPSSAACCM